MDNISDEVLLMILLKLHSDDLKSVSQVNKRFRSVSKDSTLYRSCYYQNNLQISAKHLHVLVHTYKSQIKSMTLKECFWIPSYKLKAVLESCTNLVELNLTGSNLYSNAMLKIMENNPNITKLGWSIPDNFTSDEHQPSLLQIQEMFKRLTSIILRFKTLSSLEYFLSVFDTCDIVVYEFGLEYLSNHISSYLTTIGNTYSVYIKSKRKFQVKCSSNDFISNRFLHFNLLVMDFVLQTVTRAANTGSITALIAPGTTNSLCWKFISSVFGTLSFEKIDMSFSTLAREQMNWLSKLKHLSHLNLSNVFSVKLNLLKAISLNCPNLLSINLNHCEDWIEKELHGLQALAKNCKKLAELNLLSLHIHALNTDKNKLCSIIASMTSLKSLAIPACSLVNNIDSKKRDSKGCMIYTPSLLLSGDEGSCSSNDSQEFYFTRHVRTSKQDEAAVCQAGCGLDFIVNACVHITHLEIVDTGFSSPFNAVGSNHDQYFCPQTVHLKDKVFLSICKLTQLRKLVLAGLSGVDRFSSLANITSSCVLLEELSIAHCGLCGHASSLLSLQAAIMNCKRLKKFRLHQPYFHIKESLFQAFHACQQLQVICLINKNGKVPKKVDDYITLFQHCTKLVGFFLFSGSPVTESKKLQTTLHNMFGKVRRSSCIAILYYFDSLTEEGLKRVPYVYLRDVLRFESDIAKEHL